MINKLTSKHLVDANEQAHARRVETLGSAPSLAVILAVGELGVHGPSESYVNRKAKYAEAIGVDAKVHHVRQPAIDGVMRRLVERGILSGMMLQLPLPRDDRNQTEASRLCALIPPEVDVDGLHPESEFDSPTSQAMMNIAVGHGFDVAGNIVVVGAESRVAGKPLARMLRRMGHEPKLIDPKLGTTNEDMAAAVSEADFVFSSVGIPGLITPGMLPDYKPVVLVDAGVARVDGKIRGDLHPDIFALDRPDIWATPPVNAVGPLTVSALIENVIRNAEEQQSIAA